MSNYSRYEEEINIFTLLWFVLSKWKSVLIIAIIGLVIGAGYAVISIPNQEEVTNTFGITEQESEDMALIAAEQLYENTNEKVKSLETYIAEAEIMKLNPYELYKGTVTYVVDDSYKDLAGLNTAIYSFVWDGPLMLELEKIGPYTAKELDYLLSMTQGASSQTVIDENATGQVVARITICAQDKTEAQLMVAEMDRVMCAYFEGLMAKTDIISYEVMLTELRETTSTIVADYQASIRSKYDTEKANLEACKSNVEALSAKSVVVEADGSVNKNTLVKYGAVGFVGGVLIGAVVWILIYLLSDKLYTVSDKERRFGVKQLGSICDFEKLLCVDRWIGQKLGSVYSNLPVEEQKKIVLLNIKNELEKNSHVKKVLLVSSIKHAVINNFNLKAEIESMGYIVEDCEHVIDRSDTLQKATQCDAVLVIENNKISKRVLVEAEINLLKEYVSTVLGMVIVQTKV